MQYFFNFIKPKIIIIQNQKVKNLNYENYFHWIVFFCSRCRFHRTGNSRFQIIDRWWVQRGSSRQACLAQRGRKLCEVWGIGKKGLPWYQTWELGPIMQSLLASCCWYELQDGVRNYQWTDGNYSFLSALDRYIWSPQRLAICRTIMKDQLIKQSLLYLFFHFLDSFLLILIAVI